MTGIEIFIVVAFGLFLISIPFCSCENSLRGINTHIPASSLPRINRDIVGNYIGVTYPDSSDDD